MNEPSDETAEPARENEAPRLRIATPNVAVLRIIHEQAGHMRGLIGDLLDAGRIEAGNWRAPRVGPATLSIKLLLYKYYWRRGRDSNPRKACAFN